MRTKNLIDAKSTKEIAIGMFYYTSGSILGPLLLFGVLGYVLDGLLHTEPKLLVLGVVIAFIITNVLLFKKIKQLNKTIAKHGQKKTEDGDESINE